MPRRSQLVLGATVLACAIALVVVFLHNGGSASTGQKTTTADTIDSVTYSCTDAGLAQQRRLLAAVKTLDALQDKARLVNDCDRGQDAQAGVEFHLSGRVDAVADPVAQSLDCTDPQHSRSALGRRTSYTCHRPPLSFRITLDPYLPASDPKGPSVLGEAWLVAPAGS
jgi:hypothetical protein